MWLETLICWVATLLVLMLLAVPGASESNAIPIAHLPGHSKYICMKRDAMTKILSRAPYRETAQGSGVVSQAHYAQLFLSSRGTWTLVVTSNTGVSCIVTSGTDWTFARPKIGSKI